MPVGEVLRCGMASPAETLSTVRRPLSMGAVQRFSLGFDAIRTTPVRLPLSMGEAFCPRLGFIAGKTAAVRKVQGKTIGTTDKGQSNALLCRTGRYRAGFGKPVARCEWLIVSAERTSKDFPSRRRRFPNLPGAAKGRATGLTPHGACFNVASDTAQTREARPGSFPASAR